MKTVPLVVCSVLFVLCYFFEAAEAGYGHHGHHDAKGTACIVKGSYCNCHYCKCEKGHVHCGGYGKHGHGKDGVRRKFLAQNFNSGYKNY
jgi:hypothetical protein